MCSFIGRARKLTPPSGTETQGEMLKKCPLCGHEWGALVKVDKWKSALYDAGQEQSRMSVARQNSPILLKEVPPKKIFLGESPKSWVGGREKHGFSVGWGFPNAITHLAECFQTEKC